MTSIKAFGTDGEVALSNALAHEISGLFIFFVLIT